MYLKAITLKGFKSFPERTRLEFGPGVSVVVGPNGSGKSNITDAVLWALGEQSASAVRGSSMQDVIFGGTPGRQAAARAEVELVLEDSDGLLGLGVPEVSIVRRLDRAGEGEYRLAGARCRLVDVIEALSETGLGKEMHSVISQGRVESLVTSKPHDRRLLIEEAAGLGKHRKRRRRAQLKLERTQQNLDRALDVEREARARLRPLKRQAEAAELHQRLERQSLEARWEIAREELRAGRRSVAAGEAAVAEARARRARAEGELEQVAERREAAEGALADRSARREELSRRCFLAGSAAERIAYRAEGIAAAVGSAADRVTRSRALLGSLRTEAAGDSDDADAVARIERLERALSALQSERQQEISKQCAELERRRADAAAALAARADLSERAKHERTQAERAVDAAREQLREAEREVEAARRESARVGAELATANQFLRSHGGAPGAAQPLAEGLDVDPGFELPVAAALDGRLRAALAADRAQAARMLDRAGADGGTVLVAGGLPARGPEPAPGQRPAPGGIERAERLADRVRGDSEAARLARELLHDAWLLEGLDDLPEGFDAVAVTRSGRVWSPRTHELRQAPAVGEDRLLAERNIPVQLIRASEAAVQAEVSARAAVERAAAAASECEAERDRAVAVERTTIRDRDEAAEEERRLGLLIERRRAAPDEGPDAGRVVVDGIALTGERGVLDRVRRERGERQARIEQLAGAVARDEALGPELSRLLEALNGAAGAVSAQRERFEVELENDRQAGEQVAAELRACAQQEATLQARLHGENESLTQLEVQAQRVRDRAAEAEAELRALAARLELAPEPRTDELPMAEREALEQRIQRLARRREQLGPVNPLAQHEYQEALEHVEELERQREDLETALRELDNLIRDTDKQIRECFERTFAATARNFEELAGRLFPGGRGRLRLVSEREGGPRVLGGESQGESGEAPGRSEEEGEEDEDILGVEIEITPAGKEMKRLSLLSGGEKSMTALAFLFAVFLARPCPFYILDEVEAALDDLNIDRFLDLLRSYSSRAQFIVVTHQKRTMEAADSLYGVSMGADGTSKVISRRLPDAEAAAAPDAETAAA
jgi:chromosome segregation protein